MWTTMANIRVVRGVVVVDSGCETMGGEGGQGNVIVASARQNASDRRQIG